MQTPWTLSKLTWGVKRAALTPRETGLPFPTMLWLRRRQEVRCEHTAKWFFPPNGGVAELEIRITLEVTVPEPDGADVGIFHAYGPDLWEPLWDLLYSALNEGVHGGLAAVATLPPGGILVTFTDLQVVPPPEKLSEHDLKCLAHILQGCAQGLLTAVRLGLDALETTD